MAAAKDRVQPPWVEINSVRWIGQEMREVKRERSRDVGERDTGEVGVAGHDGSGGESAFFGHKSESIETGAAAA